MKIIAILENTFKESLRSKVMYFLLIIALFFITSFSGCILGSQNMTVNGKQVGITARAEMVKNIGFNFIIFFGVLITSLISMGAIPKDIESKAIILVLTKPLTKAEYLIGKILGIAGIVYINLLVMSLWLWLIIVISTKELNLYMLGGIAIIMYGFFFFSAFVSLLSLYLPSIISGLIGIITYIISGVINANILQAYYFFDIREYLNKGEINSFSSVIKMIVGQSLVQNPPTIFSKIFYGILYVLIPQFGNIESISRNVFGGKNVELMFDWWSMLFLPIYVGIVFYLFSRYFENRDVT